MSSLVRESPMFSDDEIIQKARSVEPHDFERIAPPPQVWNNILAEVEVETASQESLARRKTQHWFSSPRLLSAAAALLLLVGVSVAYFATSDDGPTELAMASMTDADLPVATTESATASVFCEDDACFVEVELTNLPDAGNADLELWVINADVTDMHSLGNVVENDGRFTLPPGVTAQNFPIVDISLEPDDGDPTHSGLSVLRGVLEET